MAACAVGAVTAALAIAPGGAGASPGQLHVIKTISTDVIAPLQFAVDGKRIFVADAATGNLTRIGRSEPLTKELGTQGSGVAVDPTTHDIAYTTTNDDHSVTTLVIKSNSAKPVVADLSGFERKHNPDHAIQYGVVGSTSNCVKQALKAAGIPVRYKGQLDSHPYAVTSLGHGNWAVADAGGNDILKVDAAGNVSLLSLLPAQILTVSPEFAEQNGLPKCTVGVRYGFEAVPTDVETGPRGGIYATTLPGGQGVPGSVYRIHPGSDATLVATGFAGATNLAIGPDRTIYVAELFANRISVVAHGAPVPVASLPAVAAVEFANGHVYAATAPAALEEGEGPPPTNPEPGSIVMLG
ncbi:MAG TPA: ScyD/ScyE family protein [Jatrophihabitans sp.]|nr:ScyD/ScyE family protein [Jatrophihabitans sp.]